MVFNIEISFNLSKHKNVTETEREIVHLATENNCGSYYKFAEMEKNLYRNRNNVIFLFSFENQHLKDMDTFIKQIKKMKHIYIECLYEDDIMCKLLYASQYYLTTIDKDKVLLYNENKRKRSYSEDENMLLEGIRNKS